MKKITTSLLCILLCFGSFAQYESFFGKNNTSYSQFFTYYWWSYTQDGEMFSPNLFSIVGEGYSFDSYFTKEDTVRINDNLFYKTSYIPGYDAPETYWGWHEPTEFDFYLRENTTTGKLYYYCAGTDTERLWCDMSLMVGDTFYFPLSHGGFDFFYGEIPNKDYIIVDSVYYLNNKKIITFPFDIAMYREKPYPNEIFKKLQLKFIEGIGPLFGPALAKGKDTYGNILESHHTILLCIHKDDTLAFMTNPIFGCAQKGSVIGDIKEHAGMKLKLTLNHTELKIEFPSELENEKGAIYIFDIIGRMLYKTALNSNPQIINISNFQSGFYIVNFRNEKYNYSSKFVKN